MPGLRTKTVGEIQEEQSRKGMHPAPDVKECKVSVERLQELIELIDTMPMCRQLIQGAREFGVCRPEPFVACSAESIFAAQLVTFESGAGRCCAREAGERSGAGFLEAVP